MDGSKMKKFINHNFRMTGYGMEYNLDSIVALTGIKDSPCKTNGGDIVYIAFKSKIADNYLDAILRYEEGWITRILKINEKNDKAPQDMIRYLKEFDCKQQNK